MMLKNKFVCCAMVVSIALAPTSSCNHEMSPVCQDFYNLSGQEREKEFPTYDMNKQLDIYVCAMRRKPPISTWAYDIAKGGEKKIPVVTQRLKAEQDPVMQYHLIHLLQIMSQEPYFRGRQDVADEVREVISRMGYSPAKTHAQEALAEIEKNSKGD